MATKQLAVLSLVALLMAGCSSVSLENPPVEERSSGIPSAGKASDSVGAVDASVGESAVARATVAPLDKDASAQKALANVSDLIYFDYDSFAIKPEYAALLSAHARYLKAEPRRKAMIEGHTDERGGREYNLALGQRRAEAVSRALVLLGVAEGQLEAVSLGKENPAVSGSDDTAWSQNRRAQISYR